MRDIDRYCELLSGCSLYHILSIRMIQISGCYLKDLEGLEMSGGLSPPQELSVGGQAFLEQLMFDSKGPPLREATVADHTV